MNSNTSRAASSGEFELKSGAHAPMHSLRAIARVPAIVGVPAILGGIIWLFHVNGESASGGRFHEQPKVLSTVDLKGKGLISG